MNCIKKYFFIFCLLPFVTFYLFHAIPASAISLTHVSDTISNSAPNESVNHTIKFTVTTAIPSSGKIVITPEIGYFSIPSGMNYTDIDLGVDGSDRDLAEISDFGNDGISIVSGNSGSISITLNTTTGIAVSSQVIIQVGGDQQIQNPSSVGSYKINIKTYDASLNLLDRADAMIAIVQPVQVEGEEGEEGEEEEEEEVVVGGGGTPPGEAPSTTDGIVTVSPRLGGSTILMNEDESSAEISFPKKAVSVSVIAKVTSIPKDAIAPFYSIPPGLEIVGNWIYSCTAKTAEGKTVSTFLKPVTLTFKYTDSQVSELDETTLKVYRGVPSTYEWIVVPTSQVNPATNTITATVTHFTLFAIMGSPILVVPEERPADLNTDKKVDLVDFSILLYNWGKPKNPKADLNNDGIVDLVDFSIMLYWWTP